MSIKVVTQGKFKGFGLICLAFSTSEENSKHFHYAVHEHTKMGQELLYELPLRKFRTYIGKKGCDQSVGLQGERWFVHKGGEYLALEDEADYKAHLEAWEKA